MPPRKNVAPSNAVRQFFCDICNKGYPRQPEYENHLRSYDHTHRKRLAEMKKITAQNEADTSREKKRSADDMRPMPLDGPNKKAAGPRFTKIGGEVAGSRFKKVGAVVKKEGEGPSETAPESKDFDTKSKEQLLQARAEIDKQIAAMNTAEQEKSKPTEPSENSPGPEKKQEKEKSDWVSYNFITPGGCNHQLCPALRTDGIWETDDAWCCSKHLAHGQVFICGGVKFLVDFAGDPALGGEKDVVSALASRRWKSRKE